MALSIEAIKGDMSANSIKPLKMMLDQAGQCDQLMYTVKAQGNQQPGGAHNLLELVDPRQEEGDQPPSGIYTRPDEAKGHRSSREGDRTVTT